MGIVDKLKGKPTAADLDGQIAALERTIADLADEHEQAEAVAVESSADEAQYAKAAGRAATLSGRLNEQRERLARLQRAAAEAREREQREYIARLEKVAAEKHAAFGAALGSVDAARKAEWLRHEEALKQIEAQFGAAQNAASRADDALRRAREGLTESAARRIVELRTELGNVRRKYGEDLNSRSADAVSAWRNARSRLEDQEAAGRRGNLSAVTVADARREHDEAKRRADELDELQRQRGAEGQRLQAEIDALEAGTRVRVGP